MLHATVGNLGLTEEEAKQHVARALASDDPVAYAAAIAASVGCGAVAGPWIGALCGMAAGAIFSLGCEPKNGTLWCLKECTIMPYTLNRCKEGKARVLRPPVPLRSRENAYKRSFCKQHPATGPGCCLQTYCQLPGMPAPVLPVEDPKVAPPVIPQPAAPYRYPAGTITTRAGTIWRVAIPKGALSGPESAYTVTTTSIDPRARGAEEVSKWRFEHKVGERSWYETPPAWIGFGLAGVGVLAGSFWIRKRKRG